ncbi:AbrB/MazE/SpoVT family DNA-binding domain-containing protein [Alkalibacillus haloalkaliphilus]|uniref:AbrB/MazE/SpoVT family DNA-binding domain-containing protein n=1 Tax=Alkalibacillus haloalkaliphilus TaxID=94136 RepID=UPI00036E4D9A|nr:hypothetical protein [Alkalibacillus haloalkaliphilus]
MNRNQHSNKEHNVTLTQYGDDLFLPLPNSLVQQYDLKAGSSVTIQINENHILIKADQDDPTLDDLLEQITDSNRHDEISFGRMGRELL